MRWFIWKCYHAQDQGTQPSRIAPSARSNTEPTQHPPTATRPHTASQALVHGQAYRYAPGMEATQDPTPVEIREQCLRIQDGSADAEERKRAAWAAERELREENVETDVEGEAAPGVVRGHSFHLPKSSDKRFDTTSMTMGTRKHSVAIANSTRFSDPLVLVHGSVGSRQSSDDLGFLV